MWISQRLKKIKQRMSIPAKLCKRGRKPEIDSHNNNCRFCVASFTEQECLKIYFCFREDKVQDLFWQSAARSIGPANRTLHFIEKAIPTKAD